VAYEVLIVPSDNVPIKPPTLMAALAETLPVAYDLFTVRAFTPAWLLMAPTSPPISWTPLLAVPEVMTFPVA
jgi:hypothetical protein